MRSFAVMLRFYFSTFYSPPALKEGGGRLSPKGVLKLVGILMLMAYLFGSFGFMAWHVYAALYQAFSVVGLQRLLLLYALLYGGFYVLLLSFISSFSTLYTNEMEAYLASLPVRPVYLLSGKVATLAIPEFFFALLTMGTGFVVYGLAERVPWLFYINALLIILWIVIFVVSLSYCVSIPLLAVSGFFRNRDGSRMVLTFALIFVILFFNASANRILSSSASSEAIMNLLRLFNETFLRLLDSVPPLRFILMTLLESANPLFSLVLFALLGTVLLLAFGALSLLAPLYKKVIQGFSEQYIKKMNQTESAALLRTNTGRQGKLMTLFLRELRGMNREPVYFLNGPFIIILMPLILGVSLFFSLGNQGTLDEIGSSARSLLTPLSQVLVSILAGAFLGSSTSITCTAISRDAKHIAYIKTLPVESRLYLGAKLLHGILFGLVGSLVAVLLGLFLFQIDVSLVLLILGSSFVLSVVLNILGLYLDTLNPRLSWDNPVAAMKQNINTVVMILLEMLILAGIGFAVFRWVKTMEGLALFLLGVPLLLVIVLLALYFPLGERKIRALEL